MPVEVVTKRMRVGFRDNIGRWTGRALDLRLSTRILFLSFVEQGRKGEEIEI